ncbi:WD40-repeat-containing domain protein [Kockovaella imperatae]|uniref:WD40-repeat-containing domain protein n=1 Tax=Kockovaella imperatae TaxID=4999 RepID=A0A1Y1U9R5_9TREE|nr:WD40-repeat-containing domain protein [Kockovaella imperatae]ORX34773.1 WD40-repeat-containing domain protein [Kockovaella imperatae]
MQTSDPGLLFRTSADILAAEARARKAVALEKRGSPFSLGAKILDLKLGRDEVIVGDSSGAVKCLDELGSTRRKVYRGHAGPVTCVTLAPCYQSESTWTALFSGSWDKSIRIWNHDTGELKASLEGHSDFIKSLLSLTSPYELLLSTSSDKTIRVWDLELLRSGQAPSCVQVLRDHTRPITSCTLQYGAEMFVWTGDSMGVVIKWTVRNRRMVLLQTTACHETSITGIEATEDGLWTCSMDKTAQFRQWSSFDKPIILHHASYVTSVLPLKDTSVSDIVLTGDDDGNIRVWSIESEEARLKATVEGHGAQVSVMRQCRRMENGWEVFSGSLDMTLRHWTLEDLLHPPLLLTGDDTPDGEESLLTEEEERELEELMA